MISSVLPYAGLQMQGGDAVFSGEMARVDRMWMVDYFLCFRPCSWLLTYELEWVWVDTVQTVVPEYLD